MGTRKRGTTTSSFGVSRRENHDSAAFYERFTPPVLSNSTSVGPRKAIDQIFCGDARNMEQVDDDSVALVVTSPPYFVGKKYEEALGEGKIPETYLDYLAMLEEVFAGCVRKLESGGRIAVNVANLGRRPYRSLSADVIGILQDRLGLLLRGEVIWQKARGAAGSCAWGSFQRPANPVLRDLTERIVIASKGRFDRALSARLRHEKGLPSEASIFRDEFMEATTDVWEMAPESATRVGHPAPFPVELPERLIHLYTYRGDLVLDPFMGSGTTAVAAIRSGRHFVGFDTDEDYVLAAKHRTERELSLRRRVRHEAVLPAVPEAAEDSEDFQATAVLRGRAAKDLSEELLQRAGFTGIAAGARPVEGVEISFEARDSRGGWWLFDVAGGFTGARAGLKRTDTFWRAIGKAAVLNAAQHEVPLVVLTTEVPTQGGAGEAALGAVVGPGRPITDVVEISSPEGFGRLQRYAEDGYPQAR